MTDFKLEATFNTICRPGQVVKILTKNGKEENGTNVMYAWDNIKPDEAPILMATYSSRRKAEKVLEDMIKLYGSYISCGGGPGILQGSGYQQAFCFLPPKVFHFPADDEVEV